MQVVYFFIAVFTTTVGSLTGMGGGVIIKPVLDLLGHYNTATIGVLSSLSVFAMAIVSVSKQLKAKAKFDAKTVIPLAIGSIFGGSFGQAWLDNIIETMGEVPVAIVQNTTLAILIGIVFIYMIYKDKIKSFNLSGFLPAALTGVFLGIVSSFLGIGGGPINVAIFMFLFSYDAKTAALSSIITILFAQISKLSSVTLTTGFEVFDLSVAPYMIVGAILGGFIGSKLTAKFTNKQIEIAFNMVQILVFIICIMNIANRVL